MEKNLCLRRKSTIGHDLCLNVNLGQNIQRRMWLRTFLNVVHSRDYFFVCFSAAFNKNTILTYLMKISVKHQC